jgi:hypothetical protein
MVHESAAPRILLRAYIRINVFGCLQLPKTDKAGTCDCYIKAVVGDQSAETDVKYRDLNPNWGLEVRGRGFTGQQLTIDVRNAKDEICAELWDFDELKALDIKTGKIAVTRCDELIGVAVPAKLRQLLNEGSSKRDFFKVRDVETGAWVKGYEQLRDQRDRDTRVEISVLCIPAWKAASDRFLEDHTSGSQPGSPSGGEGEEQNVLGIQGMLEEEELVTTEARLLGLFEKFSMYGKSLAAGAQVLKSTLIVTFI